MLRYGYFDSEIIGTDAEGMPIFDRAETSDLFRLLFAKLVSNGVLADPGDCFQVLASEGLNLTVRPGFGLIQGAFAYDDSAETYTLAQAPTQYARIDRIVLRANYADRLCEIVVKTGEVAATPVAPELLQPASGDYYELSLATVYISANATAVTQSNITDTRGDSSVYYPAYRPPRYVYFLRPARSILFGVRTEDGARLRYEPRLILTNARGYRCRADYFRGYR